jgi:predicted nucleic acid-binding protein
VRRLCEQESHVIIQRQQARQWWEGVVNSDELIGLPDPAIFGFLCISTNPRLIKPPLSADEAARHVET